MFQIILYMNHTSQILCCVLLDFCRQLTVICLRTSYTLYDNKDKMLTIVQFIQFEEEQQIP